MARKTQAPSTALVVQDPKSFAVGAPLKDRFAAMMSKEGAAKVGSTLWPFLGTRGAQFRMGTDRKLGTEFDGVILGTAVVNQYYEGDYDPDNAAGPVCFAIADLAEAQTETELDALMRSLAPPKDLATKVSERCDICQMNAWGSGKGRGKACKNGRRVTVVGVSENYAKTEGARLNIPVTSVRKLADYTKRLAEVGRPLLATVTRFSLSPGDRGGFEMDFEAVSPINDGKTLDALEQRAKEGRESLIAQPSTEPRAEKKAAEPQGKRRMVKRA